MYPPLVINVDTQRQACVLDVELALSQFGLLFSLRAAQEMNVWLVRALWDILDNTQFYLRNPDLLMDARSSTAQKQAGGRNPRRREHAELIRALNQWQTVRLESDLAGLRVYWAGDAKQESLLPKDCDEQLIPRFEQLAACLDTDSLVTSQLGIRTQGYNEFARDTVALAAALVRYRPVIFTRLPGGGKHADEDEEPLLCRYLRRCDIPCQRIDGNKRKSINAVLWNAFINRNSIHELLWSGLRVAAVHIVAPGVLALPAGGGMDEGYRTQGCDGPARHCWQDAQAWWYPLSEH